MIHRMSLHMRWSLPLALSWAFSGCFDPSSGADTTTSASDDSGDTMSAGCEAGPSTACTCPAGGMGAQACLPDGSGYGACVCTGDDAGSSSGESMPTTGSVDPDGTSTSAGDTSGSTGSTGDEGSSTDSTGAGGCAAPAPVSCDDQDDDVWHALGLNCAGGPEVDGTTVGDPAAFYVHAGNLGTYEPPPFPPQEGEKFLVLSSGIAADLATPGLYASTNHLGNDPLTLPLPLNPTDVSGVQTCAEDPALVGTGDCSNTIQGQWSQGSGAYDYAEMRLNTQVPDETFGFSYDLALFSTEYPDYYQAQFNDMYVAWLESEAWTGNISFDAMGNPMSLNAAFLAYKDAPNAFDCPDPCEAPELAGTAMEGHAGTTWLRSTVGVAPGESIELVLAIFDLSDGILDTIVLLDNWQWLCDGGAPETTAL